MDHERCSELLPSLVQGKLEDDEKAAVEAHLGACEECARERRAVELLLTVQVDPLSTEERERIARAVATHRAAEERVFRITDARSWGGRMAPALGAAALIALIAVGSVFVFADSPEDGDTGIAGDAEETFATPEPESLEDQDGAASGSTTRNRGRLESRREELARTKFGTVEEDDAAPQSEQDESAATSGKTTYTGKNQTGTEMGEGSAGSGGGDSGGEPAPEAPPASAKGNVDDLAIAPQSDSGAVGSCKEFTITTTAKGGKGVAGIVVDVEQRHQAADDGVPNNEPNVSFCFPGSGPNPSGADTGKGDLAPPEEDPDNAGTAGGETSGTTNGDGQVTIGITVEPANGSDGSGTVTLVAFVDDPDDDDPGDGDPKDTATNTWKNDDQRKADESQGPAAYPLPLVRRIHLH